MKKTLIFFITLAFLPSCGTLFSSREQELSFDSNIKNVDIYINDLKVCSTPCIASVPRSNKTLMIKASKSGYEERTIFVQHGYNPIAVLNVLSGITSTFGVTTDATDNHLWQYAPNSFYVTMYKEPQNDAQRKVYEQADRIRDFVLKNYAQLQSENFENNINSRECIKAVTNMSGTSDKEISALISQSISESECAERITAVYLKNIKKCGKHFD